MFNRKRSNYRKKAKKVRPTARKQSMVKLIKKVLQKTAETKLASQEMVIAFGNIQQSPVLNVRTLSPSSAYMPIINGTSQDERIGNRIQTKRVTLRYILHPLKYNATNNTQPCPMDVIMWIGKLKRSIDSPTAANFTNFLQFGSVSVAPIGDLSDINSIINRDYFDVTKKIIHKVGTSGYAGTPVAAYQNWVNNDYKYNVIRTINLTKHFAKNYIFNDADNDPQNSRTYIWFEAVRADGDTNASTQIPMMFRGTLDYNYTDV